MGTYLFLTMLSFSGSDNQPEIHWSCSVPIKNQRWTPKSNNHIRGLPPRYFHTIYLIKSKPNALYSSYRMSQLPSQPQLMISGCYDELLVDPTLLQMFPEDEWTSIHKLPYLGALHCHVVSEGLFNQLISPELWGQARVDFVTDSGRKATSEEVVPVAILVTDGVDEGTLGMATVFCHSDQVKLEPLAMLSTLLPQDSPVLGMVVMKIFTNLPISHGGLSASPFWT